MISLLCFLMLTMTGSTLHQASAYLLLAGVALCFGTFTAVISLVAMRLRRESKSPSKSTMTPSTTTKQESPSSKRQGTSSWAPLLFMIVFCSGLAIGHFWPRPEHVTLYGLRVQKVLSDDSLNVISAATGPVRIDICPENHMEQYLPKAGYVFCRIVYTPRGCMDVDPRTGNKFEWVVDKDDRTTTVSDRETFRPWPDCHKEELTARGY